MSRIMTEPSEASEELASPYSRDATSGRFAAGGLDSPISGIGSEEAPPAWSRPAQARPWPNKRYLPTREILAFTYPDAWAEFGEAEYPTFPMFGAEVRNRPAIEYFWALQKKLAARQLAIDVERSGQNMVTYANLHGTADAKPAVVRCRQCSGSGKALQDGVCWPRGCV